MTDTVSIPNTDNYSIAALAAAYGIAMAHSGDDFEAMMERYLKAYKMIMHAGAFDALDIPKLNIEEIIKEFS